MVGPAQNAGSRFRSDGRSLVRAHAAGKSEDMDLMDCNGPTNTNTHIGRRVIHCSTGHNEQFTPCCSIHLSPSSVNLLDETETLENLSALTVPAEVYSISC